jgi:probable rRNA maturation factor
MTRSIYRPPWRIDLDVREGVRSPVPGSAIARTAAAALDEVGAPSPASIGLILSDDAELAQLNATHMGVDGPTDVLSFPLLPASAFRHGAPEPTAPRPPGMRIHLGDIVMSVERATDQAATGRGGQTGDVHWSAADEVRLLVTHGVLHICGWDHSTTNEEASMRAIERRLLGDEVRP